MTARQPRLPARAQRGAALVTSLVILLVLTVLGLAAMRTSSLEERMAGNAQDALYAFQAAESGLNAAMNDTGSLSLTTTVTNTYSFGSTAADTSTTFSQFSPPRRGSGYSATSFEAANFDQTSKGKVGPDPTNPVATVTVKRGLGQIVPKSQ